MVPGDRVWERAEKVGHGVLDDAGQHIGWRGGKDEGDGKQSISGWKEAKGWRFVKVMTSGCERRGA